MFETVTSFFPAVLAFSGVLALAPSDSGAVWVLLAASALLVTLVLAAAASSPAKGKSSPGAERAIDVSVPVAQSDPDAAGHPRSRAPGSAASAA
jgi:hypothetical protein